MTEEEPRVKKMTLGFEVWMIERMVITLPEKGNVGGGRGGR